MWQSIRLEAGAELQSAPAAGTAADSTAAKESAVATAREHPAPGGWRLATLLVLFGASLVFPSLIANGLLLERQARLQNEEAERRVQQVAADLINDIDRDLSLMATTLTVLAASPDLAAGRLKEFHAWAAQIARPLGLHILYRDLGGQQLLNTRVTFGTALPGESLPESDAAVRATLKPHVSDLLVGAVHRNFVVTVTVPVQADGELRGFLHFSIDSEYLFQTMKGQKLPPDWITTVVDRKGVVIARLQNHEAFVGTPMPDNLRADTGGRVVKSANLDNVEMLRSGLVSSLSGWTVAAGVRVSAARAKIEADWWMIVGATLALSGLALGLAFAVARLIAGPIRQIADFAVTVENQLIPPPMHSAVREANEVGAALRQASVRLAERTHELREALDRFNAALHGADIVVFVQGRDRRITWISESVGYRAGDFVGKREEDLADGAGDRAGAIALREKVFANGQPQEGELVTGNGEQARHFRQRLQAIRDDAGDVVGVLGVSVEITSLRREQARNLMLVRELAHRSKNLLAVVQAIAGETLRSGGPGEFMQRFAARLQSLGRLQDLVISGARGGVEMGQLVKTQLAPFAEPGRRLEVAGPRVRLRPEAANILGMALHELATNATKYGSLSVPEGAVAIGWLLVPEADGTQRFRLTWRETGGPPVSRPAQEGFGSRVVTDMTATTLTATVDLDYLPGGIVWRIDAPASNVVN